MEGKIVGLVDEILKIKNRNVNEDRVEIEREIDGIVWLKPVFSETTPCRILKLFS